MATVVGGSAVSSGGVVGAEQSKVGRREGMLSVRAFTGIEIEEFG